MDSQRRPYHEVALLALQFLAGEVTNAAWGQRDQQERDERVQVMCRVIGHCGDVDDIQMAQMRQTMHPMINATAPVTDLSEQNCGHLVTLRGRLTFHPMEEGKNFMAVMSRQLEVIGDQVDNNTWYELPEGVRVTRLDTIGQFLALCDLDGTTTAWMLRSRLELILLRGQGRLLQSTAARLHFLIRSLTRDYSLPDDGLGTVTTPNNLFYLQDCA